MALRRKNHPGESPAFALPVFALILALCTATPAVEFAGGTGEPNDPYQIATAEQLIAIGSDPNLLSKHFVLVADLDLDPSLPGGRAFDKAVIAPDLDTLSGFQGQPFTGSFDGQRHVVSGLTILSESEFAGLFGKIGPSASVRNLGIHGAQVTGKVHVVILECGTGVLAGENWGTIANCYCVGSVSGTVEAGGLVGHNEGTMLDCYAKGLVTGRNLLGGLVGVNPGQVVNCYADVTVSRESAPAGGLVGSNDGSVTTSYAVGRIQDRYPRTYELPADGGLAEQNHGRVVLCYWDVEASGAPSSYGGFGCTSRQMKTAATYVGWSGGHWTIREGQDYPRLVWEAAGGEPIENARARTYAGTGDPNNPFILMEADDLMCMMARPEDWGGRFELGQTIEMNGVEGYLPPSDFAGTLDGKGYEIQNLSVAVNTEMAGLIGCLRGGRVSNLGVVHATATSPAGEVGLLVGRNQGAINECWTTGTASGSDVGGLAGTNYGAIRGCRARISIDAGSIVGGLVGSCMAGSVTRSSSTGAVKGTHLTAGLIGFLRDAYLTGCYSTCSASGLSTVGGLVGLINRGRVINCYAAGEVFAQSTSFAGGLVGENYGGGSIQNSYAAGRVSGAGTYVGGLVGQTILSGKALNSFWGIDSSGQTASTEGTSLTEAQMRDAATFVNAGWDFVGERANGTAEVWLMPAGGGYPELAAYSPEYQPRLPAGKGTRDQPYQIASAEDLGMIGHVGEGCDYVLTSDVDLSGITWTTPPIADLGGRFDGSGHRVVHLTISGGNGLGLFGVIGLDGVVTNLGVEQASVSGITDLGCLAGWNNGSVLQCRADGAVAGSSGGVLTGYSRGEVTDSYATGQISGGYTIGGIAGVNEGYVHRCYSASTVLEGGIATRGARLVGQNGYRTTRLGQIADSFWDAEAAGATYRGDPTALSTTQMQTPSTFLDAGWDFVDTWMICEGRDYPRLRWEEIECDAGD